MIEGGFWSKETPGTLEQCHLRILIRPHDSRGSLLVQVDLASESWTAEDRDLQQSVAARFLADYAAIDAFAAHFELVLDGNLESAILAGSRG